MENEKLQKYIENFRKHFLFSENERELQVQFCKKNWQEDCERVLKTADELCNNIFLFQLPWDMEQTYEPVEFKDKIKWDYILNNDKEFIYQMNRHRYWICLGQAYALTKDEKYVKCFVNQLLDWVKSEPCEKKRQFTTWRTLETGLRAIYWIRAMAFFADNNLIDINTWQVFFESLEVHADWLYENKNQAFSKKSNWGVMEHCGLYGLGKVLNAPKYTNRAIDRLKEMLKIQIMDDGMQWEQSPMYHNEVLMSYLEVIYLANIYNEKPFTNTELQIIEKMAMATLLSQNPKCRQPMLGDSDDTDIRDITSFSALLFNSSTLKKGGFLEIDFETAWRYSSKFQETYRKIDIENNVGNKIELLTELKNSGQVFYRSDWRKDADWIHFINGSMGGGHGHYDKLHIDLFLNGEEILTDSGRFTYTDTPIRYKLKSASAHNVPMISNVEYGESVDSWTFSKLPMSTSNTVVNKDKFVFIEGAHFGYLKNGIVIKRSIVCIENGIYAVMDEFLGNKKYLVSQNWHFAEKISIIPQERSFLGNGEKTSFLIQPFVSEGEIDYKITKQPISRHYNLLSERERLEISAKESNCIITFIAKLGKEQLVIERKQVHSAAYNKYLSNLEGEGFAIDTKKCRYALVFLHQEVGNQADFVGIENCYGLGRVMVKRLDEKGELMTVLQR